MKDYLLDVITHTNSLDGVDLIKITGTDTQTQVNAIADNKNVIISGTFKNPIIDFAGVFGMPNLSKLKTILSFDEYDEKSKIAVLKTNRNGEDVPSSIHFETSNGDFVNDYRLMSKELVEEKVKATVKEFNEYSSDKTKIRARAYPQRFELFSPEDGEKVIIYYYLYLY